MNKKELRKKMKALLKVMNKEEKETEAQLASQRFINLIQNKYPKAKKIGLYASLPEEMSTKELIHKLLKLNYHISLPRVLGPDMSFYTIDKTFFSSKYETSIYGISEPEENINFKADGDIDIMLIPGLAFDYQGYRLGRGKGFYDKYLNKYPNIIKIAYAHQCQRVGFVPHEKHDVRVNHLIIPNQTISFL